MRQCPPGSVGNLLEQARIVMRHNLKLVSFPRRAPIRAVALESFTVKRHV
jgi:hypothetical protein